VAILGEALTITLFVFSMMVLVDWLNVHSRGGMTRALRGRPWRGVAAASFLGATPGCLGAFMDVSLYVHGVIGFGALVGGMIATSGDEAYVMLSLFPRTALLLFGLLFAAGIVFGILSDLLAKRLRIQPCAACDLQQVHLEELDPGGTEAFRRALRRPSGLRLGYFVFMVGLLVLASLGVIGGEEPQGMRITLIVLLALGALLGLSASDHYLRDHLIGHVLRHHTLRVFLWTFGALLLMTLLPDPQVVRAFVQAHRVWILLLAGLIGVIPESGPHMIFVMMFASGLVPFSVLFVSSFVQDGHGMLPLLSTSVRDAAWVKGFNLVFGLAVGGALYLAGL